MISGKAIYKWRKGWENFEETVRIGVLLPIALPFFLVDTAHKKMDEACRYPIWLKYWTWKQRQQGGGDGFSPLDRALKDAVQNKQPTQRRNFLERGANPNLCYFARQTLLLQAVVEGNVEIARLLLKHGAEVDACDPTWKATPLIYAAIKGRCEAATLLLEHGASLTQRCYRKQDALYYATFHHHPDMVQLLLKKTIERGIQPSRAEALMTFALERRLEEVVVMLEELGVPKNRSLMYGEDLPSVQIQNIVEKLPGGMNFALATRKKRIRNEQKSDED